ncbi:MAG: hypothetical protein K6G74_03150 [Bacilli bacterium]|nr:hypothetical protein [Bacilli bacterium]
MTLRNLLKKALAFAVGAFCSLASFGTHHPSKESNGRPMMHDSLYDPWVSAAYNALPDNPDIEPCLDGFYAPVYFSNLRSDFGTNRFGTCAFVAMGMLLSFYDAYWDDSIVPSVYEVVAVSEGDPINGSIDSPGSSSSLPLIGNSNIGYYLNTIVPQNDGVFLDMKLMTLASDYQVAFGADTSETGLDYSGMYSLFQYYLYSYMGFSTSDIGFAAEPGAGTGQAKSDSVRDFAIENVSEGIPVLLSVGTDHNSDTGRHSVIAYDYDEANDLLYCHMGWGPKATHVTIESFGYASYNSAFALAVRTQHSHSEKYRQVISGYCLGSHCACEFAAPYDIKKIDWYRNKEAGFEWSCVDKERWVGEFVKYNLNIMGSRSLTTSVNKNWAIEWLDRISTNSLFGFIFNESSVSISISAEYEDDYYQISSVSRSATFSGIVDFEGAHNVHPADYGFSSAAPTMPTLASHSLEGGTFGLDTVRKDTNYDGGMLNVMYAGSGHSDGYIEYHTEEGVSILGVDFAVRFWDDTNASHFFRLEYYEDYVWNVGANLLDPLYDIAGSDGSVRWIHLSFGKPVEAFMFHAGSMGSGYYDSGIAGIMNVAIYTDELPTSGSELPYSEGIWNGIPTIMSGSNCYRYAFNFPNYQNNHNYWDPGDYSNYQDYVQCVKEMIAAATLSDVLAYKNNHPASAAYFCEIGRMETCPVGCYKVALAVMQYCNGLHWFRQNPDGTWSQKNNSDPITDKDALNRTIFDPQFCNTQYNWFCGYYCVGPWTGYGVS